MKSDDLLLNRPSIQAHKLNRKDVIYLAKKTEKTFLVVVVEGTVIKRIMLLDILVGSGIYYTLQWICSSIVISMLGSVVGTEGIKKVQKQVKGSNIKFVRTLKTAK